MRRVSSLAKVDLPDPVRPTTATCSPGSIRTVTSRSTSGPAPYAGRDRAQLDPDRTSRQRLAVGDRRRIGREDQLQRPTPAGQGVLCLAEALHQELQRADEEGHQEDHRDHLPGGQPRRRGIAGGAHHTPPRITATVIVEIAISPSEVLPCSGARVRSWLSRARSTAASSRSRVRVVGAGRPDHRRADDRLRRPRSAVSDRSVRHPVEAARDHPLHQRIDEEQHAGEHEAPAAASCQL